MRRRLQIVAILVLWLLATGNEWNIAQVIAWGRMYAGYSQRMSAGAAIERTFNGELCAICKTVRQGRQDQESKGPATGTKASAKQIVKFAPTFARIVYSPLRTVVGFVAPREVPAGVGRTSPETPPPRPVV